MKASEKKIAFISKHFGTNSGGEAIKGFQFAKHMKNQGVDVTVITHQRAIDEQGAQEADVSFLIVPETWFQSLMWRGRMEFALDLYFHIKARGLICGHVPRGPNTVLHYISPVSPVTPRFFPKGYNIVVGPLTGNISYPPAFRDRMTWRSYWAQKLHPLAQKLQSVIFPEKYLRVRKILVSGYERTRQSLRMGGVAEEQMIDVVDSGVSDTLLAKPRIVHKGYCPRFVASGRFVDHKGFDLAIHAVAQASDRITLDIYGGGEKRAALEALVKETGLEGRVAFKGWMQNHEHLLKALSNYRGYLFPSLAEANGIVMQEAMMIGLPVIATRWGGPAHLADDSTALYVDPISADHMVAQMAQSMDMLADNPERAEEISRKARLRAEANFSWEAVSASWLAAGYTQISAHSPKQSQTLKKGVCKIS